MSEAPTYLGTAKFAALVGFSERQVRTWCAEGKLEGAYQFQHNGKWLIPITALERIRRPPKLPKTP